MLLNEWSEIALLRLSIGRYVLIVCSKSSYFCSYLYGIRECMY